MKPGLLVACHDAGGAEVVSSWVLRHLDKWNPTYLLDGPAIENFERKLNPLLRVPWVYPDFVLCGSSSKASLERHVIKRATQDYHVRCAVYLDHWTNYRERFDQLPDEVWVCDEHAEALARKELPGANIIVKGNPYLEDIAKEVAAIDAEEIAHHNGRILCAYGPTAKNQDIMRLPDEFAMEYGRRHRPHPSDMPSARSLAEDIAWADVVIGYDTMALVAALYGNRRVISLLPASESRLPFPEIERPRAS